MAHETVLDVRDLTVEFPGTDGGWRPALRGVSLAVAAGERVALVGESGSGKSVLALAALGLVSAPGRIAGGKVLVAGADLSEATPERLRALRGGAIGLVFQEPAGAFNPVFTIGFQLAEAVRAHRRVGRANARAIARRLLERTALDDSAGAWRSHPHQLSGGQLQRAMIALALAGDPGLLIADEPTTALDLETQARILDLLRGLAEEGRALLLISHDLAVVAGLVDRVVVLFAGEVVEVAPAAELFARPLHPYTRWLLEVARELGDGRPEAGPGSGGAPPAAGCRFAHRCELVQPACRERRPALEPAGGARTVRCPVAGDAARAGRSLGGRGDG
ncbi:MAG TPA: ABC transporter ATP-binding protein [Thermoanaerobaculia bacterium]|nr:ABC transporter ATP-binding protein [Thermoanaerobaculia bacterium]